MARKTVSNKKNAGKTANINSLKKTTNQSKLTIKDESTEKGSSKSTVKTKSNKSVNDLLVMNKQELIKEFAQKTGDTGSPEVQVALATHKILNLSQHLEENPKDNHSRRGLLKIIAKRRRILNYLEDKDMGRYQQLLKKLHLKK